MLRPLFLLLLVLGSHCLQAQPGPSSRRLLWKIAVAEKDRILTIDSTNWLQVKFRSGNADIKYRFIPQTGYFEIILKSMMQPELTVSYKDIQMSFPQIDHFEARYYKKVILGLEPAYDPARTGIRTTRAFFNDPDEHMRYRLPNSTEVVTICPKNIVILGSPNNPENRFLNQQALLSLTRYKAATPGNLYCRLNFNATVDTVNVPTDLKPYAPVRLSLTTQSPDNTICTEQDSMVYYTVYNLPLSVTAPGASYQLQVNGKAVNNTYRLPHRFVYASADMAERWIDLQETDPAGMPNTRTIFYSREYSVSMSPAYPTASDPITLTVVNRLSTFTDKTGQFEYRIAVDENNTYAWNKEIQIALWHNCGAGQKEEERSYTVKLAPLQAPGQYMLKFYGGFLDTTRKRTTEKHCFEPVPIQTVIEVN